MALKKSPYFKKLQPWCSINKQDGITHITNADEWQWGTGTFGLLMDNQKFKFSL